MIGTMHILHKDGMIYHVSKPSGVLRYYVDSFMVAEGFPEFTTERLFPNNEIELFFNLGDLNQGKIFGSKPEFQFKRSVLSGLRSSFLEIHPVQ